MDKLFCRELLPSASTYSLFPQLVAIKHSFPQSFPCSAQLNEHITLADAPLITAAVLPWSQLPQREQEICRTLKLKILHSAQQRYRINMAEKSRFCLFQTQ
jgi:hypothetical protein